jgi:hypothetical protein
VGLYLNKAVEKWEIQAVYLFVYKVNTFYFEIQGANRVMEWWWDVGM